MFKNTKLRLVPLFLICTAGLFGQIITESPNGIANQKVAGALTAQYNDPTNTSGLGAAAIRDGIINVALVSGVTLGSGNTTLVREATATAIQAALTYGENNGYRIYFPPGIYEIYDTGLEFGFTGNGAVVYGSGGRNYATRIIQYNTNVPVAIVGPGYTGSYVYGYRVSGISFEYGVSQSGDTGSNELEIGALSQSAMEDINVGYNSATFAGYRAVYQYASAGEFSNTFRQFTVNYAQLSLVEWAYVGSGSMWEDWYIHNGALNAPGTLSSYAWNFTNCSGAGLMLRINIEAVKVNNVFHTETCRDLLIEDTHLETVTLTGSNPAVFYSSGSRLTVINFWMDFILTTGGGASGHGRFTTLYGGDYDSFKNIHLVSQSSDSGAANLPFAIFDGTTSTPDQVPSLYLDTLIVDDFNAGGIASEVYMSNDMPLANFDSPAAVTTFQYNGPLSFRTGAILSISSAYTVYGADQNPTVNIPAAITSFTLTLADIMYSGSTTKPQFGAIIHVRRAAGTASGTLTISDATAGTITTNTAAATDLYFQYLPTSSSVTTGKWQLVT